MTIRYLKKHAALEGVVGVEDAETLAHWLQQQAKPAIHLGKCQHLHAAVLQVLLTLKPKLIAAPVDPWLTAVLKPALAAG